MADAYGMITFVKSTDGVFNPQKMKGILNTFNWDNSGAHWGCDGDLLFIDNYGFDLPQYPNAIPLKANSYVISTEDGESISKDPSEMTSDDWDNIIAEQLDPMPLRELSEAISPLLESGWIEIACVANEKARYVYFESMRVYADGRVFSRYSRSGPGTEPRNDFEEYVPNNASL